MRAAFAPSFPAPARARMALSPRPRRPPLPRSATPCASLTADRHTGHPPWPAAFEPLRPALTRINDGTKWAVSLTCLGLLLHRRDAGVAYALIGAVVTAGVCKALKKALGGARPTGSPRGDEGMPSSHATSLAYLASYGALSLGSNVMGAASLVMGAAGLGSLRVALGFHTSAQVAAGFCVGGAMAAAWRLAANSVVAAAEASAAGGWALAATTVAAVAAFGGGSLRRRDA